MVAITVFFSWWQLRKSRPTAVDIKTLDSNKNVQNQKAYDKYIDTKYEYKDATGVGLIIQNSFPKSGINYTDLNGKKYVYAVFWTRIINKNVNPVQLSINFPLNSFELPTSSGNYVKLLLPSNTITHDKIPLFDYGLSVKSFLDQDIHKSSSLKRIIDPNESSGFYLVTLSNQGVNGKLRTGFSLRGQKLFYRIIDKEIPAGEIKLKN